jgi:hypothetical protein
MGPSNLLPGLWVAALAALLGLALRRWFDPVPRRCWLAWGAVLALLLGAVLFGGKVLLPLGYLTLVPPYKELWAGTPPGNLLQSDLVLQITPWLVRVREAFAAGEWPLWNALSGAGEPLLGNPQTQALQPLAWLALVFPIPQAVGVIAALRLLIPFVFTWLFLRRQGISERVSLGGSLAFGLSGFLQHSLGWPLAGSATFLPLLLYGVVLVEQRGLRRDQALLAAAALMVLLVGHPETGLHVVALAAVFALSLLFARPAGRRLPLLRAWAAPGLVGLALAAPAVLPAVDFIPQSLRAEILTLRRAQVLQEGPLAGWRTPEERARSASALTARVLPAVTPNAYGHNRFGEYWGARNINEDAAGFTGTAALLAALLAAWPLRGARRFPQERLMLAVALACLVILARPPGLAQLFEALPVIRQSLSYHSRVSLVLNFVTAYLAACTWERWRLGEGRRPPLALTGAALAALIVWGYLAHPDPEDPTHLTTLRYGTLALQLATLLGTTLLMPRSSSPSPGEGARGGGRGGWGVRALPLVVAAELLLIHAPANPPVTARLYYPETRPIAFIKERLDPWYRMSGVGPALRANFGTVYGIADPRSSNPMKPAAYLDAIGRINLFPRRATDGFASPEDPLYGLLGVRYVMTAPRLPLPPPLRPVLRRPSGWVYRRPGALPRLFLPASAAACPEADPFRWSDCNAGIRDFARQAVLRPGDRSWAAASPAASSLGLGEIRSARLGARARLAEPRLLASSVYQDGGWRLVVGGERRPTTLANGPFVAAWLPRGDNAIELLYRPAGFLWGMVIAALALASGAALWVRPPIHPP